MKDKLGNELTPKEFMQRWKGGIQAVTPSQINNLNIIGNVMIIVGILIGIYATYITHTWWLVVILVGSLFLSAMSFLGYIQRYYIFKELNKQMKEMEVEK